MMHESEAWMGGMWFVWLLVLLLVVAVGWFAASAASRGRRLRSNGPQEPGGESPEQTLKRRYANGEVDRETYQRMLADLKR